jgi:hypothetical protein
MQLGSHRQTTESKETEHQKFHHLLSKMPNDEQEGAAT